MSEFGPIALLCLYRVYIRWKWRKRLEIKPYYVCFYFFKRKIFPSRTVYQYDYNMWLIYRVKSEYSLVCTKFKVNCLVAHVSLGFSHKYTASKKQSILYQTKNKCHISNNMFLMSLYIYSISRKFLLVSIELRIIILSYLEKHICVYSRSMRCTTYLPAYAPTNKTLYYYRGFPDMYAALDVASDSQKANFFFLCEIST